MAGEAKDITVVALVNATEILLLTLKSQVLPAAVAAKILRLEEWAIPHYQRFLETRGAEAERFGKKLEEGKWQVPNENLAALISVMEPVGKELVRMPGGLCLSMDDLAGVQISPKHLKSLEAFMVAPPSGSGSGSGSEGKESV